MDEKPKIGIVTVHRINHFGSVLQAYALQKYLLLQGYTTEIIDYIYPNEYHRQKDTDSAAVTVRKLSFKKRLENKILRCLFESKYSELDSQREKKYEHFKKTFIKLGNDVYPTKESLLERPPVYDIYMTGSDQTWNPFFMRDDTTYLLGFTSDTAKKISYAASFGRSSLIEKYKDLYSSHLNKYLDMSVREYSGLSLVKSLTGRDASLVLDPTLLLSAEDWNDIIPEVPRKKKYILCYFLNYSFDPYPYLYHLALNLQKETGFELVQVDKSYMNTPLWFKSTPLNDCGPRELLALFKNASLVITTSFHGTAFSVNFKKPLFSVINDQPTADCRQKNLLEVLGMEKQLCVKNSPMPKYKDAVPNYEAVEEKLNALRIQSKDYLKNALTKCE